MDQGGPCSPSICVTLFTTLPSALYINTKVLILFFYLYFVSCASPSRKIELQDMDSDPDVYGQRREPSQESLSAQSRAGYPESLTPTFLDYPVREAYPAWSIERQIPLSKEEIEVVYLDLAYKFGFQRDSIRNMVSCLLLLSGNSTQSRSGFLLTLDIDESTNKYLYHWQFDFLMQLLDSRIPDVSKSGTHFITCGLHRWTQCELPKMVFRRSTRPR